MSGPRESRKRIGRGRAIWNFLKKDKVISLLRRDLNRTDPIEGST